MKKLLSKFFFASDCARGAAFATTLLTIGNYLWLSFFLMASLRLGDFVPPVVWIFVVGAGLMTLYALALAVASVVRFVRILRRERRFKVLWYLLPAGACLAAGVIGFLRFFPPYGQASVALGFYFWRDFYKPWVDGRFPGVAPEYWAAIFFAALLLILAGGMLLTAMFAAAEGKKLRSAFGRATLTVWGVLALWYFVTLGLALHESREVAAVRAAVEARFGRPLTAAALGSLYREGGPVDAKFWQRQQEYCDALPLVECDRQENEEAGWKDHFCAFDLPDRPTPETLAWYGGYCRDNRAALARYEGCFDRVPPLPARDFVHGQLLEMPLDYLQSVRSFVRMERSRLSCALASGDVGTAWVCYRRMGNAAAVLQKLPFLIDQLVWIAAEYYRLTGVEKLLESRLLPDSRLDELDADLAALELAVPRFHRLVMYGEATFFLDLITALEEGLIDYSGWMRDTYGKPGGRAGAFAPYRWIFPQYWYHAALDKEAMLRFYLAEDFTKCAPPSNRLLIMSCLHMFPGLIPTGGKYYALTARTRGMRTLIRAEKYRRTHGEFPKTLADLPEDPFTGKPLIYEIGPAKISERVWKRTVTTSEESVERTADVVQVRSSDPAMFLPVCLRRPEDGKDATRAPIRR